MSKKGNETGMSGSIFYRVADVGKYLLPPVARPCLYAHKSQPLVLDRSNGRHGQRPAAIITNSAFYRSRDIAPDVLDGDAVGGEEPLELASPGLFLVEHAAARVTDGLLGPAQVGDEVRVVIVEEQVVVDELLARDDAEEVHEPHGVRDAPEAPDPVDPEQVRQEDGVLVPALVGPKK